MQTQVMEYMCKIHAYIFWYKNWLFENLRTFFYFLKTGGLAIICQIPVRLW